MQHWDGARSYNIAFANLHSALSDLWLIKAYIIRSYVKNYLVNLCLPKTLIIPAICGTLAPIYLYLYLYQYITSAAGAPKDLANFMFYSI